MSRIANYIPTFACNKLGNPTCNQILLKLPLGVATPRCKKTNISIIFNISLLLHNTEYSQTWYEFNSIQYFALSSFNIDYLMQSTILRCRIILSQGAPVWQIETYPYNPYNIAQQAWLLGISSPITSSIRDQFSTGCRVPWYLNQ